MQRNRGALSAGVLGCVWVLLSVPVSATGAGVAVRLEAVSKKAAAQDPLKIKVTLTNSEATDLVLLKWNTPFEGFNSDLFQVRQGNRELTYVGRVMKRAAPTPEDYLTLKAGESTSTDVDLGPEYSFGPEGPYQVRLRTTLVNAPGPTPELMARKVAAKELASDTVTLELTEPRIEPKLPSFSAPKTLPLEAAKTAAAKAPTFTGCLTERQTAIKKAHTEATSMSLAAIVTLDGTSASDRPTAKRYRAWFGAFTSGRYGTVTSHYGKIHGTLVGETVTFNCGCTDRAYAYVYPTKPYEVFLCNAFWPAPMTGTDSKAGTIIHELSHFNVVAGTNDHAYGHENALELAVDDPDVAINNADSHEYFAENTPPLSMALLGLALTLMGAGTVIALKTRGRPRK
jgi:peptidyl-Lys metalloendopeptidase